MAGGAGFFYSKCEFLAGGISPLLASYSLSPSPSYSHSSRACAHVHVDTRARACARVRALVSDDGAGNGVSDETELTQVDLPRRWRGAPDT